MTERSTRQGHVGRYLYDDWLNERELNWLSGVELSGAIAEHLGGKVRDTLGRPEEPTDRRTLLSLDASWR